MRGGEAALAPAHGQPPQRVAAPAAVRVAVVIPSFRAAATIGAVLARIGPEVGRIYVVDDGCPDSTGRHVLDHVRDPRVSVICNDRNLGVGGAVKRGYRQALADGADIVVKLDADGQMDPAHIPLLIAPILAGRADYAKGNRFAPARLMPPGSPPRALRAMPLRRRLANAGLGVLHKAVTGYWRIDDPANGYTAIHVEALRSIALDALADCFFFETDMLFALNVAGGVVADVPLPARYASEVSSLKLRQVAWRFMGLIPRRFCERLAAKYLGVRINLGSLKLAAAGLLVAAAIVLGLWGAKAAAALCVFLALASLAAALAYDALSHPREPLSRHNPGC